MLEMVGLFFLTLLLSAETINATVTCHNPDENNFYVNDEHISYSVIKSRTCTPDDRAIKFQREYPAEIIRANHFAIEKNQTVNVTWVHQLPENNDVVGYVLRLTTEGPKWDKCYWIQFNKTYAGSNTFRLDCISWVTSHIRTCSSVYPVVVEKQSENSVHKLTVDIAYNRECSVMRITSNYHGGFPYNLRLVNGSTERECQESKRYPYFEHMITKHQDVIYIEQPYIYGDFCIQLDTYQNSILSLPFNFERSDDFMTGDKCDHNAVGDRCDHWNASIFLSAQSKTLSMDLMFSAEGSCSHKEFQIRIFNVNLITCRDVSRLKLERCTHIYDGGLSTTFSHLKAGNYCVRIIPISDFCGRNKQCSARYSGVEELRKRDVLPAATVVASPQPPASVAKIVIPILSITALALIIVVIFLWRKCRNRTTQLESSPMQESLNDVIAAVNRKKPVKIFLIHSLRNPLLRDAINHLVNVLQFCLHCEVTLSNYSTACKESDKLGVNHLEWVSRKLKTVNFVLVAVPDYDLEDTDTANEDHSMYLHGIEMISAKTQRNICAFRFDNCPLHRVLADVDHTSWTLPKQLGNFFAFLHDESILETEFQEYWKNSLWLINLKQSLNSTNCDFSSTNEMLTTV